MALKSNTNSIFVAHGLTSSGKTETANYLAERYDMFHFHPIGFIKREYARLLQKPDGFLDTAEGKSYPIPGNEGHTMQELMVALYHFYRHWMPNVSYSCLNMAVELPKLLAYKSVCVVSLRNPGEVDQLLSIRNEGNHKLILLSLHRHEAIEESSDEYYNYIRKQLTSHCDQLFPINNNFTIEHLHELLDDIMNYCHR